MPEIILKPGREKSVLRRHPWIFSGAIQSVKGEPGAGATVEVLSSQGEFLARAAYSPTSNIMARIWTWDENEAVNQDFFEGRLRRAIRVRQRLVDVVTSDAMRLVHGESDGLPGLILDKYADVYVAQFMTAGSERWKAELVNAILHLTDAQTIYERSDADVRQLEGLTVSNGLLYGTGLKNPVEIHEHGIKYLVDFAAGHKTGFYLDQRDNRWIARQISQGLKVLDCFAYTGGFAANCLLGGAQSVRLVESSAQALEMARNNITLNNLDVSKAEFVEADVFKYLRELRDRGETFDLVILDPPKFAPTAAQAERASRGYKDINLLAFKLLNAGGYLLTFSCSGGVSEELFQKIVTGAAQDAQATALILQRMHQAADHPVGLNFPEGAYLKGFLIQKLN